ncbi:WhiB family transcriptional regulator [Streptomyces sp. NPDC007346]|uniref:WhiB family transcriptional regulator n=1 Tax=Streptomyces sp. NPDC007346 TaxID=3154682 RepID=UPI003453CD98
MPRPGRYWPDTRHDVTPRPEHWDRAAACREHEAPQIFFPEGQAAEVLAMTAAAKAVCRTCPVVHPCLVDALERGERWGVWGGLDEDDRARLLHGTGDDPPGEEGAVDARAQAQAQAAAAA